jgi:M6 family metalloprotease-like protein
MIFEKPWRISILAFLWVWFSFQGAYSIGAYPFPRDVQQPDGSMITLTIHGDEWFNWVTTIDGYRILKGGSGLFEYAAQLKSGEIVSSGTRASNPDKRSNQERSFLAGTTKNLGISRSDILRQRQVLLQNKLKSSTMSTFFPPIGESRMLVILVNFSDTQATYSQSAFDRFMNEANYNGTGSFNDYYQEVSGGLISVNSTVTQWVTLPSTHDYYGPEEKWGQLAYEAIKAASVAGVDFSLFDNDHDGVVEGVAIIHQGAGQEVTGDESDVWSHSYTLSSAGIPLLGRTFNGVLVDQYTIQPEWLNENGSMNSIGIICHEFGHNLGLFDFYDTLGGEYAGTGRWDLMASGAYNGSPIGSSPAHHNPFSKAELGWVTIQEIDSPMSVELEPVTSSKKVLRVNASNDNEYLLLENRRRTGFDRYLPGEGMIVYHADSTWIADHRSANIINTEEHQGFYPVAAGGQTNSASCPFPGSLNVVELTDNSTPNVTTWEGQPFNRSLTNIATIGTTVYFDFMSLQDGSPLSIKATSIAHDQLEVSWVSSSDNYPVLLAWSPDNIFGDPEDTHLYQEGDLLTGGGTVLYYGSNPGSFIHEGLTASTHYYYSVWSNKGDLYSQNIKTSQRTQPAPVNQFPWFDGFEDGFTGWRQESVTGNNLWTLTDDGTQGLPDLAHEGQYFATLRITDWTGPVTRLISPVLNITDGQTYFMDFRHVQPVWENDQDQLRIIIRPVGGEWEELVLYEDHTGSWAHRRVKLPYSQPLEVAFEGMSNYGYGIGIDSVVVYPVSECIFPPSLKSSAIAATEITENSMTVTWNREDGDALLVVASENNPVYELPVNGMSYTGSSTFGSGDDLGQGAFVVYNGSDNQIDITGLQHTSDYYFSFFEYYTETLCYQYLPAVSTFSTRPRVIDITIEVTDTDGLPVEGARVQLEDVEEVTNTQGLATFPIEYSSIYRAFAVSMDGMKQVSARYISDASKQISVQLSPFDPLPPSLLSTSKDYQTIDLNWTPVINDDFENYQPFTTYINGWTLLDKDASTTYGISHITFSNEGSAMAFMVFDAYATEVLQMTYDITAWSGSQVLACFAAVNPPNDDWIISPVFEVNENDFFSFMGRSLTDQFGLELFNVMVKRVDESDWTTLDQGTMAPVDWTRFEYNLATYAGEQVQVAIQCVSNDAFALLLDDLRVGPQLGALLSPSFSFAPTPPDNLKDKSYRTMAVDKPAVQFAEGDITPLYTGNVVYQIFKDQSLLTSIYGFENINYTDTEVDCATLQYEVRAYYPQINVSSEPSNTATVTSCFSVLFTINNPAGDPVDNAKVTFNFETKYTNQEGQVLFEAVSLGPEKSFAVDSPGFEVYQSTVDVAEDKSLTVVLQIATLEINTSDYQTVQISPNPTKNISILEGLSPGDQMVRLFDVTGKQILTRKVEGRPTLSLDLSPYPPGLYLLVVSGKEKETRIKVVKIE